MHASLPFRPVALASLVSALALGLSACGPQNQSAPAKESAPATEAATPASAAAATPDQAAPGTRLTLAVKGEPQQGYDPVKGWGNYGNPLFQSTLLKRDDKLSLVGDLATQWGLSKDSKTWTITIRDDAKFADGQPLTAEDVAFTFETAQKAASTVDLGNLAGVRVVNPTTVEITLHKPQVTFTHLLATLGIVPKHAYADGYGEAPLGSGPFRLVSWSKGQQMIAEPNPHYYGKKPEFERITFLFTEDDATVAAANAGQVNVASVPPALSRQVPGNMVKVSVKTVDNRGIMFPTVPAQGQQTEEGFDLGNSVTADPAIRKAVNMAINRQQLVDGVLGGHGVPAWGVADNLPWDNPEHRLSDNDMAGAEKLLQAAGWKKNANGVLEKNGVQARIPLLYFSNDSTRQALALAVADMVKPLGIVFEVAGKTREEVKRLKHSSAVLYGWGQHSPIEMYNLYLSSKAGKGSYNTGFYKNPKVDAYLEAAERANSFDESLPHWKNAQWDGKTGLGMKGDAPWAWLVNLDHVYFVDKCLDIGPRQIEPHGHGYPITWNVQDWKWMCK
ncbi:MAG: ABC transporter substrate-binding protein [Brachymonas sp.]|nr:ABC transporter substrate-binding protein [Brachymonas sp.]